MTLRHRFVYAALASLASVFFGTSISAQAQPNQEAVLAPSRYAPGVPLVYLSAGHAKLCKVRVGEQLPTVKLPRQDGPPADPLTLAGAKATVVLVWSTDGWMSRAALQDLGTHIVGEFDPKTVSVVGIAVESPAEEVRKATSDAGANFPQFLDAQGLTLDRLGGGRLPRIYVLDGASADGSPVAWFDIEYSEATRRELRAALTALAFDNRK